MSPDRQPIIDKSDEVKGFYMACGFSGHGFMFAPMTGLLMAELVLDQRPTLDMQEYRLNRFNDNQTTVVESSVV